MNRLSLLFLVVGGLLLYFSFRERNLAEKATPTPEAITLQALIDRGPDGNPHVEIKDFALANNFIYETESEANKDRFKKVWLPAAPLQPGQGGGMPAPAFGPIAAIIKSTDAKNRAAVEGLAQAASIRGLVVNKIESLGGEERRLLEQNYPGTNFERCLIIDHNRWPSTAAFRLWLLGGGLALLVAGAVFLVLAYTPSTRRCSTDPLSGEDDMIRLWDVATAKELHRSDTLRSISPPVITSGKCAVSGTWPLNP
jgi:hypothetical protein